MQYQNYKSRSWTSIPTLLGLLLVLLGMFTLASPVFMEGDGSLVKTILVGVVAVLLGLIVVTTYSGTLLDIGNMRVKEYKAFMGLRFGEWRRLPDIEKVIVIEAKNKVAHMPNGITPTWSGTVVTYNLMLIAAPRNVVLSLSIPNKERVTTMGKNLAARLQATYELKEG